MAQVCVAPVRGEHHERPSGVVTAAAQLRAAIAKYEAQDERSDRYTHVKMHPDFLKRLLESFLVHMVPTSGYRTCYGFIVQSDDNLKPHEVWFHGPHRPLGYRVVMTNP